MKEIDFLPDWYKSGRRRQISYRTQYVALGGVFVIMVVWNLIAAHSISKAAAELTVDATNQAGTQSASQEFARIKSEVAELQKKAQAIEQIDSKIDVASVLAEMSFLIDEKIVLSKVEFIAERFEDRQEGKPSSGSAVRVAGGNSRGKRSSTLGEVRFRIVVGGVASDASDVAELVCRLEESAYFCEVTSSWRNREIKAATGLVKGNFQVSEFEIRCYLANYQQEEPYFAKEGGAESLKAKKGRGGGA